MSMKSEACQRDEHDLCDGCNLDSPMGCMCRCHEGGELEDEEDDDA